MNKYEKQRSFRKNSLLTKFFKIISSDFVQKGFRGR